MKNKYDGISIATSFDYSIPFKDQVELVKNTGFQYISIGANQEHLSYLNDNKAIINFINSSDIKIDTVHAPNLSTSDGLQNVISTAKFASQINCETVVFHASAFDFKPEEYNDRFKMAYDYCSKLDNQTSDLNIKYAIENVVPGIATDLAINLLKQLDPDRFGLCYDSAHDQMDGPRDYTLLETHKDRIFAVHLSDRLAPFKDHVVPGDGFLNWDLIMQLLSETAFSGPLLFEVMKTHAIQKKTQALLDATYSKGIEFTKQLRIKN